MSFARGGVDVRVEPNHEPSRSEGKEKMDGPWGARSGRGSVYLLVLQQLLKIMKRTLVGLPIWWAPGGFLLGTLR